jgi:predicted nucleic acid-binding protein
MMMMMSTTTTTTTTTSRATFRKSGESRAKSVIASASIYANAPAFLPVPPVHNAIAEVAAAAAAAAGEEKGGGAMPFGGGFSNMNAPSTTIDEEDGIQTVLVETEDPSEKTGLNPFNVGKIFSGYPSPDPANEFEDGVQAASLGSTIAFTVAVILLVIITGGTLYVSAREAMDRKEEADAREEMERQERIIEANKGKLNQAANKRRKPKVSNLDKLVAEGIIEPGSANAASKKKMNRKERREQKLASGGGGSGEGANASEEEDDD